MACCRRFLPKLAPVSGWSRRVLFQKRRPPTTGGWRTRAWGKWRCERRFLLSQITLRRAIPYHGKVNLNILAKPAHGATCTRCGVCCRLSLCRLARDLLFPELWEQPDVPGPCPLLETGPDDKSVCGLTVHPATYFPLKAKADGNDRLIDAARELIGVGIGCDSFLDDEPENENYSLLLFRLQNGRHEQIRAAQKIWGVPEW